MPKRRKRKKGKGKGRSPEIAKRNGKIFRLAKRGLTYAEIGKLYNISTGHVSNIVNDLKKYSTEITPNTPGRKHILTPEQLQKDITEYFKHCDKTIIKKQYVSAATGKITIAKVPKPYTVAGLASFIGVSMSRLTAYQNNEYAENLTDQEKKQFQVILKNAKKKIEASNLEGGMVGIYESRINALNLQTNFGYSSKKQVEVDGNIVVEVVDYSPKLVDSQRRD